MTAAPVTALEANKALLQHFWDLASSEQDVRVATSAALVKELVADQARHEDQRGAVAVQDREDALEHALRFCSPLLVYSLKRLAKGLSSSRESARQGFSAALCAVLAALSRCISEDAALQLLQTTLAASRSMKKREATELLMGQVFGVGALVRAGRVHTGGQAVCRRAVTVLLSAADHRAFLRESVAAVLLDLAGRLSDTKLADLLTAETAALERWLQPSPVEAAFPEGIHLALRLWSRFSPALRSNCPLLPPGSRPAPKDLFTLTQSEQDAAAAKEYAAAANSVLSPRYLKPLLTPLLQSSATTPRLHSVWGTLLALLIPGFDLAKARNTPRATLNTSHLEAFWRTVVEEGLLVSSHERKFVALELMQVLLPHLRPDQVSIVLSKSLMRCVVDTMKDPQSFLRPHVTKAMRCVRDFAERHEGDSGVQMAVTTVLKESGVMHMKGLFNSKIVKGIKEGVDADGVRTYMQQLMDAFITGSMQPAPQATADGANAAGTPGPKAGAKRRRAAEAATGDAEPSAATAEGNAAATAADGTGATDPSAAEQLANANRRRATEQLAAAARYPGAAPKDVLRTLSFLAMHAFFQPVQGKAANSKIPELVASAFLVETVQPSVRQLCAARLVTLVGALCPPRGRQAPQQPKKKKKDGKDGDAAVADPTPADAPAAEPASKKRKGGEAQPAVADAAAAAVGAAAAPTAPPPNPLPSLLQFVDSVSAAKGAELAAELPEAAVVAWQSLRQLTKVLDSLPAAAKGAAPSVADSRRTAFLHLVRVLQVYLLGDASSFQSELVADLNAIVAGAIPEAAALLPAEEPAAAVAAAVDEEDDEAPSVSGWFEKLVDLVLSFLTTPSARLPAAPLREAVEEVWRTTCRELTPASLQDLLRVIGQDDLAEVFDPDNLSDDEEVEQDEEDSEDKESDDDAEDQESDDEAAEEAAEAGTSGRKDATAPSATAGSSKKAAKKGAEESEDEESSDEGATDADMFRLDARFASMLQGVVDKKQTQEQRRQALAGLRFRVITLLEIFAKKEPHSPLLLLAVVPLLRAAAKAARKSGGDPTLHSRCAAVLHKLCSGGRPKLVASLPDDGGVSAEELTASMQKALFIASRDPSRKMWAVAGDALVHLVRCAAAAEPSKEGPNAAHDLAKQTCEAAVTDFFDKRRTRLPRSVVERLLTRAPTAALGTLPAIVRYCTKARTAQLQVEAISILSVVLKMPKTDQVAVQKALEGSVALLGETLVHVVTGRGMKKDTQVAAVKLMNAIIDGVVRLTPGQTASTLLGHERIKQIVTLLVTVKLIAHPGLRKLLDRTAQVTGVTAALAKATPDEALRAKILASRSDVKDGVSLSSAKRLRKQTSGTAGGAGGTQKAAKEGDADGDRGAKTKDKKKTAAVKAAAASASCPGKGAGKKRKAGTDGGAEAGDGEGPSPAKKRKAKEEAFQAKKAARVEAAAAAGGKLDKKGTSPSGVARKATKQGSADKAGAGPAKPKAVVTAAKGGVASPSAVAQTSPQASTKAKAAAVKVKPSAAKPAGPAGVSGTGATAAGGVPGVSKKAKSQAAPSGAGGTRVKGGAAGGARKRKVEG